ncbi:MAG TPA: hypothetical protein VL225_03765 [Vicinamibacterales bacterium]|jgi:hypothetical protein|nr:hypothetical protein [Vicinamibacterales bacterium]
MVKSWRLLVIAAVMNVMMGAAAVCAQTVMVRNVAAGTKIEVVLNGAPVGSGAADADGQATVALATGETIGAAGIDATIAIDVCQAVRRVMITERTRTAPAAETGCDRRDISGLFWVRKINTIVVDLSGNAPSLLLIKGTYVYKPPRPEDQPRVWRPLPTGLLLFGGAGTVKFDQAFTQFCGNVDPCTGRDSGLGAYTFGATYWFNRFIAAEGGYIKPRQLTAKGGDTFTFNSTLDTDVFTIVGKAGIPAGPVRIYGFGGGDYHQAASNTSETIDLVSQTFSLKTKGWSWLVGGGGEVWVWPKVALYGELQVVRLKGPAEGGGEVKMDDTLRVLAVGIKVRLTPTSK